MASIKYILSISLLTLLLSHSSLALAQQLPPGQRNTSVTLTVPVRDEDIPVTLSRVFGKTVTQKDATLTYEISYESLLSYALPLTIQASWTDAMINGSPVQLADYKSNSGTNAYNNTPPIIDPVNQTITWHITSLPPGEGSLAVYFSLQTNAAYLGEVPVSFNVNANVSSEQLSLTPLTFIQYYKNDKDTSTSSSQNNSSSSIITTPAPSPTQSPSPFSSINVQTISPDSAGLHLSFTSPSRITVRYGTSPKNVTNILRVAELVTDYTLILPDLMPNKPYYFTITAQTDAGSFVSNVYTFTTAKDRTSSFVNLASLIITTDTTVLTSSLFEKDSALSNPVPAAVLTTDTPFDFRFAVSDYEKVRKIVTFVKNAKVLGITTYASSNESEASTNAVEIVEIARGIYSGRLKTTLSPGIYTLIARISDANNNITEQPIARLSVVKPLTVLEEGSNHPLENARVLFYRKHPRTQKYTLLSEQSIAIKNPLYTEPDGTIPTNLIPGEYKIHVSATQYTSVDSYFTIAANSDTQYPTLHLKKHPFSLYSTVQYYTEVFGDFFISFNTYLSTLGVSHRMLHLISLISLCFFVIVTTLSFCIRFHIPMSALPSYLFSHMHLLRNKQPARTLSGTITDATHDSFPIHNAIVYLLDLKRRRILLHTQTNKLGQFSLQLPHATSYLLLIKKRHYLPLEHAVHSFESVTISLQKDLVHENRLLGTLRLIYINFIGLLFEILLLLSLLWEVIFAMSFGFVTVTPYLFLSLVNLLLWILFVRNQHYAYSKNTVGQASAS